MSSVRKAKRKLEKWERYYQRYDGLQRNREFAIVDYAKVEGKGGYLRALNQLYVALDYAYSKREGLYPYGRNWANQKGATL